MRTGVKIIAALIIITLAAAAGAYLWVSAVPPMPFGTLSISMGDRPSVDITDSTFASDFSTALSDAALKPFGRGEITAVMETDNNSYIFSKTDQGLLITVGPRNYLINKEAAAQLAVHTGLAPLYADYYPRPLIIETGEKIWHVPPMSGEWEYLGIDGNFHTYDFGEMCPQMVTLDQPTDITYRFESAAKAPYILYGDSFEARTGEAVEASFPIEYGQILTLSATPSYETNVFRGSLSFVLTVAVTSDDENGPPSPDKVDETPPPNVTQPEPERVASEPSPEDPEPVTSEPNAATSGAMSDPELAAQSTQMQFGDITFSISEINTFPGEMLMLKVYGVSASEVVCSTNLRASARFFDDDEGAIGLIPVRLSVEPGNYSLALSVGEHTANWAIHVQDKEFVVQHLTVDQATTEATILSQQANAEYNQKIEPLKSIYDPEVYWSGSFILPVQGRITTEFGTKRYTNGSTTPDWHAAIDIGAAQGTPVLATNSGRVVFSEYIALTGNTILIEHGIGLKSWYYHMDSLNVSTGDMVAQSQIIGTVGSTGFSTGPHLHFGMSVGEYYVNPWSFID